MLPLSNGSDSYQSAAFRIQEASAVGEVRRFAVKLAEALEMNDVQKTELSIVVNELGNNIWKYASGGHLILRRVCELGATGVEVLAVDAGPGMNLSQTMIDGFSSGSTPGTGLGAVRRIASVFDVHSVLSHGTVVLAQVLKQAGLAKYQVGAVCIPYPGETFCGDGWSTESHGDGIRAMVVDGLGHGPLAHAAAVEAIAVGREDKDSPLERVLPSVHSRLKGTRGAAVFFADFSPSKIVFSGVGNIKGFLTLTGRLKHLLSQNGTAGLQMRLVPPITEHWDGAGSLILHSDGLNSRFDLQKYPGLLTRHPSIIAATLWRDSSRGTDDATVLVIRTAK